MVARCEVHGTAVKAGMKTGEKQYMSAFALNEWDSKLAGGVEWRQKIDTQVHAAFDFFTTATLCNAPQKSATVRAQMHIGCSDCACVCQGLARSQAWSVSRRRGSVLACVVGPELEPRLDWWIIRSR